MLNESDIGYLRTKYRLKASTVKELAEEKQISADAVLDALKGKTFPHIKDPKPISVFEMGEIRAATHKSPSKHPKTISAIQKLVKLGYNKTEIVGILVKNGTTMYKSNIYKYIKQFST